MIKNYYDEQLLKAVPKKNKLLKFHACDSEK